MEAGELVPLAYPPTVKVAAYRCQANPDVAELKDWLYYLVEILKKVSRIL